MTHGGRTVASHSIRGFHEAWGCTLANHSNLHAPPLEVFCGSCRDGQSRRRCRGSVVVFKLPDGTMGHWSLHEFMARAEERRVSGDSSYYTGLALCIIMQHFAVNEDAALKQKAF